MRTYHDEYLAFLKDAELSKFPTIQTHNFKAVVKGSLPGRAIVSHDLNGKLHTGHFGGQSFCRDDAFHLVALLNNGAA